MSLTDDWKAGTLEDGFYYVLTETDETAIAEAQCGDILVDIPEMILEVLAPVPSYKKVQAKDKKVESLKELLKKCKANFIYKKELIEKLEELENPIIDLLTSINTAIGESEE